MPCLVAGAIRSTSRLRLGLPAEQLGSRKSGRLWAAAPGQVGRLLATP
jgi:hypothetical protein